jgi:uncharacterized protein (DUF1697 family)
VIAREPAGQGVFVALLRGVNVGGKNALPMKALVGHFEAAGCADVRTYIQSGNVLFRADAALAAAVPAVIAHALVASHGLTTPVVLRSAAELAGAIAANPFLPAADPGALHLAFLAATPAPQAVAALDPQRSPGDAFAVRGREVYLHCPGGLARTKLTNAWLDRQLATVSTVRNWRTVQKLDSLARAL